MKLSDSSKVKIPRMDGVDQMYADLIMSMSVTNDDYVFVTNLKIKESSPFSYILKRWIQVVSLMEDLLFHKEDADRTKKFVYDSISQQSMDIFGEVCRLGFYKSDGLWNIIMINDTKLLTFKRIQKKYIHTLIMKISSLKCSMHVLNGKCLDKFNEPKYIMETITFVDDDSDDDDDSDSDSDDELSLTESGILDDEDMIDNDK